MESDEKKKDKKDSSGKKESFDIRFERVILLLEVEYGNLEWDFMLSGVWGSFIHLVADIPDSGSASVIDFLDAGTF